MKLAFVTPRYGPEVIGGAELGARLLAEHAVAELGWYVQVLTTCALDADTWADHYAPGSSTIEGVAVHRFRATGRDKRFESISTEVFSRPGGPTAAQETRWFEAQGPWSPALVDAVAACDADVVSFYPYLYHPTVEGLARVRERAVMHPAAHEEAPIYLPRFKEVFGAAAGFVFHTDGERRLVERIFPRTIATPRLVLGLGTERRSGDAIAARAAVDGLGERPYVVCVGRVDRGKGTDLLARFFATYKERRPGPLALVVVGPVRHAPPPHPDVIVAGRVDEAVKWGLLRGSELLVTPSPFESFSFVVLEAWDAGVPCLVNARCDATREHCEASGGGLWFDDYPTFEVVLDRLLADRALRSAMAAAGARYVDKWYRWPAVMRRYGAFLGQLAATLPGR